MTYRIKGTLKLPSGQPAAGVDIEFISRRNYSPLLMDLSSIIKTTQSGAYDITLEFGEYAVVVYWGCNQPSHIGKLFVYSDTATGLDLQTLLQQSDWQPATPEYIQQIHDWLTQANTYASQAAESAAAAKASENAVEADRAEVASNKTIVIDAQSDVTAKAADVSTKAEQVATKAEQVAANTVTAGEKADLAAAAADTASQKAASAAESDASARDAATRAENAALAMTGAILDGGECDLSSGFYPQPLTVNGQKYSTVWYVKTGGYVGGITYDAGDKLQYTTANNGFYFRIDARDEVVSINGEKGAITLTPEKIGADPAGTASSLVERHATKAGAHNISGVSGLQEALASKLPLSGGKLSGNLEVESDYSNCIRLRNTTSGAWIQLETHPDGSLDIAVTPNGYDWFYPIAFNKNNNNVNLGPATVNGLFNVSNVEGSNALTTFFRGGAQRGWVGSLSSGDVALYRDETSSSVALSASGDITFTTYGGKSVEITNGTTNGVIHVKDQLPAISSVAALRCAPTAGGWDQWKERAPAVLIDCQNQNAAYTVWKATHWGVDHFAAMQVHHRPDYLGIARLQVKTASFDFAGNGNLTCVSLTQLSDLRKKKNVSLLAGESRSVLDTLRQVEVIRYDENACPDIEGRKGRIGYNAQQLVKVMPEMVHMDLDGFYSVAYADMSAANTAAIQELVAMVEALQDKVNLLESELKKAGGSM